MLKWLGGRTAINGYALMILVHHIHAFFKGIYTIQSN